MLDWGVISNPQAFTNLRGNKNLSQTALEYFERNASSFIEKEMLEVEQQLSMPNEITVLKNLARTLLEKKDMSRIDIMACVGQGIYWMGVVAKPFTTAT